MLLHALRQVNFNFRFIENNLVNYRYVRNMTSRGIEKRIKGKVVNVENDYEDEFPANGNYDDIKKYLKKTFNETDEMKIEDELTTDEYFGATLEKTDKSYAGHEIEENQMRWIMKKNIIRRKYFKCEAETNLLTYAAKRQIRYLHQYDPLEWTPKRLSESFPISVDGVKKLLKSNFVISSPQRIEEHDAQVAEKWKILKSGKMSVNIRPATQKLWNEGKLLEVNYDGDSNLPMITNTEHPSQNTKKSVVGEHSAIVQRFLDYKKNKLANMEKKTNADLKPNPKINSNGSLDSSNVNVKKDILPKFRIRYPSSDELNDQKSESYLASAKPEAWEPEIPYSQFKTNLQEEFSMKKYKTSTEVEYQNWMEKQEQHDKIQTSNIPYDSSKFYTKIQKHNTDSIEFKKDRSNARQTVVYTYDEKIGYQYPVGQPIKTRINIPANNYKKGCVYQLGQCFYDDTGEFLYKLPTNKPT